MIFRAFLVFLTTTTTAFAACDEARVDLRGNWGQARFAIELADTPSERSLGLMHREHLAQSAGMLFVYERPQTVAFWRSSFMRDLP